jgi:hypothetical protein
MLVKFSSPASGSFPILRSIAERLLRLMGHSGRFPGALRADDIPAALERLQSGLDEQAQNPAAVGANGESDDKIDPYDDPPVPLRTRALPLIAMLEAASREHVPVIWETAYHSIRQPQTRFKASS